MNKLLRDILLAGGPLITGVGATLMQALTVHHFDPWLIGTAALSGLLTIYLHLFTTAASAPTQPPAGP